MIVTAFETIEPGRMSLYSAMVVPVTDPMVPRTWLGLGW